MYKVLIDPEAIAKWKVPDGMTCQVHAFDSREGGQFRISLTYDAPTGTGKTTRMTARDGGNAENEGNNFSATDTYHGYFAKLVPNEQVVEVIEFETDDPAMRGEMIITVTLSDMDGRTELNAVHADLPPGLSPADNEIGWRMALEKLAKLVGSE